MALTLQKDEARRIAVSAQRLDADRPDALVPLVEQLTFLQLDPTAAIAPSADLIAYTRQSGGNFQIGTMKPDGSGERILVDSFHAEGPTFCPNGRVIMFFRDPGGDSGPGLWTVDIWGRNEQQIKTQTYASDPNWGALRS